MITFSNDILSLNGKEIQMEFPILSVVPVENRVYLLFRPESKLAGQFHNLICLNKKGERLWRAELPVARSNGAYYSIDTTGPLIAHSFSGFTCELNPENGKILNKTYHG